MSNKNTIARTAAALAEREAAVQVAVEAARQEHAGVSTERIEARMVAFAEVVRNTRRKMTYPAGFDWALHSSFKVVAITDTHLRVEATKGRGERVTIDVPCSDLSLSTWQVTGIIRRLSAERLLGDLNATVAAQQKVVAQHRKEVAAAETSLADSERVLSEASAAVDRRVARMQKIEAKREAARARRKAPAEEMAEEMVGAQ